MSSISIVIMRVRTTVERVVAIEDVGKAIVRWGLVVVLAWIGGMKFTAYEAVGIQPVVAHSPLVGWMYDFLSVRSLSAMLGCIEIVTAALISLRYLSPKATLGFPALSAMPGQFLLKDIVLFGASVWSLGESLKVIVG
jgi:uncharacterized membrane protein YkgB